MSGEVDFMVPVYNEGSNFASALAELYVKSDASQTGSDHLRLR